MNGEWKLSDNLAVQNMQLKCITLFRIVKWQFYLVDRKYLGAIESLGDSTWTQFYATGIIEEFLDKT